jgi:hypothetical protein
MLPLSRWRPGAESDDAARILQLSDLGRLDWPGVLTDAEFAAEKALREPTASTPVAASVR